MKTKIWRILLLAAMGLGLAQAQSLGKQDVPENWKQVNGGPYIRCQDNLWRFQNPFTGNPCSNVFPVKPALPAGFVDVYGAEPNSNDFPSGQFLAFAAAHDQWLVELKFFKGAGIPEWANQADVDAANKIYAAWDLQAMRTFENRFGWTARIGVYEFSLKTALQFPHLVVAIVQIAEVDAGRVPAKRHPFVPPSVWPDFKPDPTAHNGP